jgi:hypothetical protein
LSSALTDINSSLQSDSPGSSTGGGNGFPCRSDSGEVSSGKLTGGQVAQGKCLKKTGASVPIQQSDHAPGRRTPTLRASFLPTQG